MDFPIRINKYLAHEGYATRRNADELISVGKVFVNGKKAVIGQQITATDTVELRKVPKKEYRYILYYKPRGVITHSPAEGETDIATRILKNHGVEGVSPVGRLDKDSEGLIILSDDGRITERLLNPDTNHEKEYQVTVDRKVTNGFLKRMAAGVNIEGYMTKPTKTDGYEKNDRMFSIVLTEGKKHQVRRMCAAIGYQVTSLKRIRIMNFHVKNLKPGQMHKLSTTEIKAFYKEIGLK